MNMSDKTVILRRSPRDLSSSKVTNLVIASSAGKNPTNTSPLNNNNNNNNNSNNGHLNNTPKNNNHTKISISESLLSYVDDEGNHHPTTEYNVNQVVLYNKTRVTIKETLFPEDTSRTSCIQYRTEEVPHELSMGMVYHHYQTRNHTTLLLLIFQMIFLSSAPIPLSLHANPTPLHEFLVPLLCQPFKQRNRQK